MTDPAQLTDIEHFWIPLRTGERLAARMWLPRQAASAPVPAILEYIPYRRRDYTAVRDSTIHPYLAAHGYACIRVDVRGTGDSDGLHPEQWSDQYDRDAEDVMEWIAAQDWCTGVIGMIGLSWGANAGLRMASLASRRLKAVVAVCAADDRYANKYVNGCLLVNSVTWGSTMIAQNTRPPDPATAGPDWRDAWLHRLENFARYSENWISHQRMDAYWASGSVAERYGDFGCPVYIVGGAADPGYAGTIPRLLSALRVPTKGLIGPWAHNYPHRAVPGPKVGFLQEVLRWFDRWLKDVPNGIENEPRLRMYMHDFAPPRGHLEEKPGRWVDEPNWPSPAIGSRLLYLGPGSLAERRPRSASIAVRTPQSVGLAGGEWMPWMIFGGEPELALDQREDDARSVVFETAPLVDALEMMGEAVVRLELSADRPVASIVARLVDVGPDGVAMRVSYGAMNLTRRRSLAAPEPVPVGERFMIDLPLYMTAHRFSPSHRIRLALSTTYWPAIWPLPETATVTVHLGESGVILPVRETAANDAHVRAFLPPEGATPMTKTVMKPPSFRRTIARDVGSDEVVLTHLDDGGLSRIDAYDLECGVRTARRLSIHDDEPTSARADAEWSWSYRRGDWSVRSEVATRTWCTAGTFEFEGQLNAFDGEDEVFSRTWRNSIRRDLL